MNLWDLAWLIIGLWLGGIANAIWYWKWSIYDIRQGKPLGKYRYPILTIFEHYHWATICFILGLRLWIPALIGFGIVLLLDEAIAQNHKFAIGSGHEIPSFLILVEILLIWVLIELLVAGYP
jgi:hypothetical protein